MNYIDLEKLFQKIRNEIDKTNHNIRKNDLIMPLCIMRDSTLSTNEKFYLCTYYWNNKNIEDTDKQMCNLSSHYLRKIRKSLVKKGLIKKEFVSDLKNKTIELSHKGKKCEWCEQESYVLQKHHYPIPSKLGGKKIVKICPNCHYTFHALEGGIYD